VPKTNSSVVSLEEIQNSRSSLLSRFERWQERWRDPMLTGLLIMLALEIFVNIPLSSAHISSPSVFAAGELILITFAVLVASRNRVATIAVIISLVAALIGSLMRMKNPTQFNILLGASCSVIFMAALGMAVWGAVFGSGRVTHHRIQGAIVLYLLIALAFATLYKILITLIPRCDFPGNSRYRPHCGRVTSRILQLGNSYVNRIRGHCAVAPNSPELSQFRKCDWPIVSCNFAGENHDIASK